MKKKILGITLVLGMLISISSCTPKVDNNIEKTWKLETLQKNASINEIWSFEDNGVLVRTLSNDYGTHIDTANYEIQKELTKTTIKIQNSNVYKDFSAVNGYFRVDKITGNLLVLTRFELGDSSTEGAFLRREFTKAE